MPCGVLIALFLVDNSSYLFSLLFSISSLTGVTILLSLTVFLNMVAETMVDNETFLNGSLFHAIFFLLSRLQPATSDAVPLLGRRRLITAFFAFFLFPLQAELPQKKPRRTSNDNEISKMAGIMFYSPE
jgi:hypothetical protein